MKYRRVSPRYLTALPATVNHKLWGVCWKRPTVFVKNKSKGPEAKKSLYTVSWERRMRWGATQLCTRRRKRILTLKETKPTSVQAWPAQHSSGRGRGTWTVRSAAVRTSASLHNRISSVSHQTHSSIPTHYFQTGKSLNHFTFWHLPIIIAWEDLSNLRFIDGAMQFN